MAMKFTFLFLNLAKIHINIPKSGYGGGPLVKKIFLKKNNFSSASLRNPATSIIFIFTAQETEITAASSEMILIKKRTLND